MKPVLEIVALAKKFCEAHKEDYETLKTSNSMDVDADFVCLCEALLDPPEPEVKLPCRCTINPIDPMCSSVFWNQYNKVVQCHKCGTIYEPSFNVRSR